MSAYKSVHDSFTFGALGMSVLKEYQQWLIEDGKSPKTIESYLTEELKAWFRC